MIVGTGIDVLEISRMEAALARRGARFENRVFTPKEIEACRGRPAAAAQFAVRFAAKEALMKAVGTGWAYGVTWRDIESLAPKGGRFPRAWEIRLTGRAAEIASELGVKRLHLAASRSRTHAMAMVVLEASDR